MSKIQLSLVAMLLVSCQDYAQTQQPIVGGIIDDGRPYVVGVGFNNVVFCTGTLISKRTVLTAAHCQGPNKIFFGSDLQGPIITVIASQQLNHPDFNTSPEASFDHDLQLLFLDEDAPTQPAPLFRETLLQDPTFIGPEFTFVGFGAISATDLGGGLKRVTQLPIQLIGPGPVTNGTPDFLDDSQFYFVNATQNTCNGDSGGPAFFVKNGVEQHIGVTSFGDANCTLDGVDTRTDLPLIEEFIQAAIDSHEGNDACRNNGVCEESCNTGGQVLDPDCQEAHCLADGLCALSCVSPRDPDCVEPGVDHCLNDGVCDPSCEALDEDCSSLCGAGDSCVRACSASDTDCVIGACGDGILNLDEECDDGNQVDNDACTNQCERLGCGDGAINNGEECDDGNRTDNDGCSVRCKTERCGDGIVQPNEACEDRNTNESDFCTSLCQAPRCGDGFQQITLGEFCDDGNTQNGDGCSETCVIEVAAFCGDGKIDPEEDCDDGNNLSNDGCSAECGLELTGGSCAVSNGGGSLGWLLLGLLWVLRGKNVFRRYSSKPS